MKLEIIAGLEAPYFQHHLRTLVKQVNDTVIDTVN
jgi:hypothetical protein